MKVRNIDWGWFDDDNFPFPETSVVFLPVIMED
jgi:hypothetical protein